MQTFLPYNTPGDCARVLDNKRLNKQILECYQILNVLSGNSSAWRNHPAVLMWAGAETHLYRYAEVMVDEANKRGIKTENNMANLIKLRNKSYKLWGESPPAFTKNKDTLNRTIVTHRANLYRKDPVYYAQYANAVDNEYNKPCCDKCNYYWPTHPLRK
jgi:hypothetical protein